MFPDRAHVGQSASELAAGLLASDGSDESARKGSFWGIKKLGGGRGGDTGRRFGRGVRVARKRSAGFEGRDDTREDGDAHGTASWKERQLMFR